MIRVPLGPSETTLSAALLQRRRAMADREFDIVLCSVVKIFELEVRQGPCRLRWGTDVHEATLQDLSGRNDCTSRQHQPRTQDGPIQHPGTDTDQAMILHLATMQGSLVTNGDSLVDDGWRTTWQKSTVVRHMQDSPVLDVASRTNVDTVNIAAKHRGWPDGGLAPNVDIADNDSGLINPGIRRDARLKTLVTPYIVHRVKLALLL